MKAIFKNLTEVKASNLKNCVGKDDTRPAMSGAYIDLKNELIVVTDAHIIVMYSIKVQENNLGLQGKIVPLRFFNESNYMIEIPSKSKQFFELTYMLSEDFAEVYYGTILAFRCRYIDATFPNYQSIIIPENQKQEINEIGMDFNLLKSIAASIPDSSKKFSFLFFGERKHILFESRLSYDDRKIKGLLMPLEKE